MDPSHGQLRSLAMDPDLADEWTFVDPVVDYAALAMAQSADTKSKATHPETYRHLVGLREGWEDRKAGKVAARLAAAMGNDETEA